MFLDVWVNPKLSTAGNDPFRISQEIMNGNYSMIWHQLIWGELEVSRVRGCMFIEEEACFRQTGERAIEWTKSKHPDHPEYVEIMEASVASVLAQRFPEEPESPDPEPPPEPPPEPGECESCLQLEADLAECRQKLETLKTAIQAALDAAEYGGQHGNSA